MMFLSFIFMSSSKHLNIQIKGIFHQMLASFGIAAWFDIQSRVIFVKVGHSQVLGLNVCSLLWYLFLFTYFRIFLIWPNKLEITCLKGQLTQKGICRHPSILFMFLKTSKIPWNTKWDILIFEDFRLQKSYKSTVNVLYNCYIWLMCYCIFNQWEEQ